MDNDINAEFLFHLLNDMIDIKKFANESGLGEYMLSMLFKGKNLNYDLNTVFKLAKALKVDTVFLAKNGRLFMAQINKE